MGGDYSKPAEGAFTLAVTADGGKTWSAAGGLKGYRSAVSCADSRCIATGTSGSEWSEDGGKTWKGFGEAGYNAVSGGWAVGPSGRIAILKPRELR